MFQHGRRYTWSNERHRPTLERINRAFATLSWLEEFPNHHLRSLSSDCSDHTPLLLQLNTEPWATPCLRFEAFWVWLYRFDDVVRQAWAYDLSGIDACRALDFKLRRTAKALKSWSMHTVSSVHLQLFMAREILAQLDVTQDIRHLSNDERSLRDEMKRHSLGLASLARTIARHRSRIRYLEGGDTNTKFFHLQACNRSCKNHISSLLHEGQWFAAEEAKQDIIYDYYKEVLGMPFQQLHSVHLDDLLPQIDLHGIDACFTEDEFWTTIKELPPDRAPGPDGFTGHFFKVAWGVIKHDIISVFNALWSLDARSFHLLNDALMVLLRKKDDPTRLKDYRPISLMHSMSKLFAKCLASRLAPRLKEIVMPNQSAFIKDRSFHDNFRSVQLACRWLHRLKEIA